MAGLGDDAPVTPMPLLFSFHEVAERLRTSERTVRRLAAAGELPTVEVGGKRRVHHEDLIAYADALRNGGATTTTGKEPV